MPFGPALIALGIVGACVAAFYPRIFSWRLRRSFGVTFDAFGVTLDPPRAARIPCKAVWPVRDTSDA